MKKFRLVLLILSIVVLVFGCIGLITTSNRDLSSYRDHDKDTSDYHEMLGLVRVAVLSPNTISESDHAWYLSRWPEFDKLVEEYSKKPEALDDEIEYALQAATDASNLLYREENGIRRGQSNGGIVLTIGGILFVVWLVLTLKNRKGTKA